MDDGALTAVLANAEGPEHEYWDEPSDPLQEAAAKHVKSVLEANPSMSWPEDRSDASTHLPEGSHDDADESERHWTKRVRDSAEPCTAGVPDTRMEDSGSKPATATMPEGDATDVATALVAVEHAYLVTLSTEYAVAAKHVYTVFELKPLTS